MKRLTVIAVAVMAVACAATSSPAISFSVYDQANSPITSFSYVISGYTVDIYETWTGSGRGFIEVWDLVQSQNYTIRKHITNSTGVSWNLFSNELLDPGPDAEDFQYDPMPYPSWVPAGFTTSNDMDGLSYAQGSGIPRTSTAFSVLQVDELSDARDFLQFSNGLVAGTGGFDLQSFGLRDNRQQNGVNQPFLLAQRPNEYSVIPEPGTALLVGIVALGFLYRRFRK